MPDAPLRVFVVAGEASGDQLGGALLSALAGQTPLFLGGVGDAAMARQGLSSLFPMEDIAVMGFVPVARRLRLLLSRIRQTAEAALAFRPDVLVLIDAPDFNHRVARRVRARDPSIPIVNYVSPTVWAWRPGRAKRMAVFVDHLLALLPFEPEAHARLGGPPTTYVGHPLIEKFALLWPDPGEEKARRGGAPMILLLPGSRRSEVRRLLPAFGHAASLICSVRPDATFVLPTLPHLHSEIAALVADWAVQPRILCGEPAKYAAFRSARAAIAASGTVTLELALSGVPAVVAYKVSRAEEWIARRLLTVPTVVLPNLILGERALPEFLQDDCTGPALASALLPLLEDGAERRAQETAMKQVRDKVAVPGASPSERAASIILDVAARVGTR